MSYLKMTENYDDYTYFCDIISDNHSFINDKTGLFFTLFTCVMA